MKSFFITTAIDYTNAAPHIGHAYEKILADVIARYHRLKGEPAFFLTGVDQHGQKVQQAAQKEGVAVEKFVAETTAKFVALWKKLDLSYDAWAATTDPAHKKCVRDILQALFDKGEIYKATYRGFYSVRQEQFLTDKERQPDGAFGPEWGEVIELEEENWYFRLSKYREWLLGFLDTHGGCVAPSFRQQELRNAAEKLSGDLSISRPKSRLSWGIELPFDPSCVTYVWFDALVNYISFAGYLRDEAAFKDRWPALHVIGKDILIPAHGIYWLAMLKAMGFADSDMPGFLVHGYVLIDGDKMSKSLGNIRDPNTFADTFGVEALRYYLMRDCVVGQDMDFTDERLIQRYNSDLANNLGNLLHRTLSMAWKYREGKVSNGSYDDELIADIRWKGQTQITKEAFPYCMDNFEVDTALSLIRAYCGQCNELIEKSAPWKLAKDPQQVDRLSTVLYCLAEAIRIIAILISPVLPKAASQIFVQLNWSGPMTLCEATWGKLPDEHQLGKAVPLFPKIELQERDCSVDSCGDNAKAEKRPDRNVG
ncbi:MAG: class I tRNA ligase family protein [Terrimicrobiaceae bacterium]